MYSFWKGFEKKAGGGNTILGRSKHLVSNVRVKPGKLAIKPDKMLSPNTFTAGRVVAPKIPVGSNSWHGI